MLGFLNELRRSRVREFCMFPHVMRGLLAEGLDCLARQSREVAFRAMVGALSADDLILIIQLAEFR
ncbi:MAG: hypothetical protein WBQ31_03670 [Candidatus Acidiferrales bacterium]